MRINQFVGRTAFLLIFSVICFTFFTGEAPCSDYQQVAGLIDIRTDFSDGAYDLGTIVQLAKKRGFGALIINDHDRMAMEYGFLPFRNILKKKVELSSINKIGADKYLDSIREAEKRHPDMIIISGSETAPFYYWTGSYFNDSLTSHNHEKRILTIGLKEAADYKDLPIMHNGFSRIFTANFLPIIVVFFVSFILGILLMKWKGIYRISGITICILSALLIINTDPFRSSPFDQYHGDQGIAPYQLLIDYVNSRGGMTFWNYPETRSGTRKIGPIFVNTPPYPEVLEKSMHYTGFAALYGDTITITDPGNAWDKVLLEYCAGERNSPAWGISAADFHKENDAGEILGNFPTVFFVNKISKADILEALRKGKMYACQGKYPRLPRLNEFSVSSPQDGITGISGDEIVLKGKPKIKISVSAPEPTEKPITVRLIRSGEVIEHFERELPMEIDYEDNYFEPGKKIYYRMDLRGYGKLVSNPIFVQYQ